MITEKKVQWNSTVIRIYCNIGVKTVKQLINCLYLNPICQVACKTKKENEINRESLGATNLSTQRENEQCKYETWDNFEHHSTLLVRFKNVFN